MGYVSAGFKNHVIFNEPLKVEITYGLRSFLIISSIDLMSHVIILATMRTKSLMEQDKVYMILKNVLESMPGRMK